jgi:hypothetical protein
MGCYRTDHAESHVFSSGGYTTSSPTHQLVRNQAASSATIYLTTHGLKRNTTDNYNTFELVANTNNRDNVDKIH